MELDDLRRSWEQYDNKLIENLKLNEELLRRSNLDRSKREMNTPMIWESVNVGVGIFILLFSFYWTMHSVREPLVLVCGGIFTLFTLLSFLYSLKAIGMLRKIDYYYASVLDLQKQILAFQTFFNKMKKFGLYTLPILLAPGMIFFCKIFYKIGFVKVDLFHYPIALIINILIVITITYLMLIWIYREFYDKKIESTRRFLADLEEFEN